jgi:hypothetical protein
MQLNYFSSHSDRSYTGRIFLFIKRNFWLFLLDFIIILFLVLPPYSWEETKLIIVLVFLLLVRDVFILKRSILHLGKFEARGNDIIIGILNKNRLSKEITEWLPDIDLEIKNWMGFPVLYILKENEVIFKQHSYGSWTGKKMKEFVDSFYDYKKEQNLWKIYKGE